MCEVEIESERGRKTCQKHCRTNMLTILSLGSGSKRSNCKLILVKPLLGGTIDQSNEYCYYYYYSTTTKEKSTAVCVSSEKKLRTPLDKTCSRTATSGAHAISSPRVLGRSRLAGASVVSCCEVPIPLHYHRNRESIALILFRWRGSYYRVEYVVDGRKLLQAASVGDARTSKGSNPHPF